MELDVKSKKDLTLIIIKGRIDANTALDLEQKINSIFSGSGSLYSWQFKENEITMIIKVKFMAVFMLLYLERYILYNLFKIKIV